MNLEGDKGKAAVGRIRRNAQKYRQTVRGIRGVSPGEEMVGYGGKDLQKRKVLSLE